MIEILKKLISFKTLSTDIDENERALNWIQEEIRKIPVYTRKFYSNGQPSLIISTKKGKKFKLILQAHLDVVSAADNMFVAKVEDGILLGRGAYDMKFAVACYLDILKRMANTLSEHDFAVMITTDEEIGGKNGVEAILEDGYSSDVCFLPDGGMNWLYESEAKGVLHLKIESKGVSAHGARPWEGKNAIQNLLKVLQELHFDFAVEPCEDTEHYHDTINIGKIEGGTEINKIPDYAAAYVDIRYISKKSLEKIEKNIEKITRDIPDISVIKITSAANHTIDSNNEYLSLFYEIAKKYKHGKSEKKYVRSHGTSDARFFSEKNIPTIVLRPNGGGLHSDNEWIDVQDLELFSNVLEDFIKIVGKI